MADFKYKTWDNTTPHRKTKIYFTAHPDDYELYFHTIVKDILKYHMCAVWYDNEPSEAFDEELLYSDLSQMQLIVVAVTARLLTTDNRAINIEIPFAIKHHIPLLPIVMEDGVDALYEKKFGNIQYLAKFDQDSTVRSYEEKLAQFISEISISDKMAEKIRAAFDVYIFLSYRKKDRQYAQRLMRLIHKNEFCRNIAIWYDEFLTLGEDFNENIIQAISKSKIFALAVTPNLVNETNYVMTQEYPTAKSAGKLMLPAELVPTDRKELTEKYDEIPCVVDAEDKQALSEAMTELLSKVAMKSVPNDPEHNFFIGLAYLKGIDVEVDYDYALSFIEQAAEAGLPEAMEKLVSMYCHGEGVQRDISKAIMWQERAAAHCKREFEQNPTENIGLACVKAVQKLASLNEEMYHCVEAEEICARVCAFTEQLVRQFGSERCKEAFAYNYHILSRYNDRRGDTRAAVENQKTSLEIYEALYRESASVPILRHIQNGYYKLARRYCDLDRMEDARSAFDKYEKSCLSLVEKTNEYRDRIEWAHCCESRGEWYRREKNAEKAEQHYQKSLEISEEIFRESLNDDRFHMMHLLYREYADFCEDFGKMPQAEQYYIKSLQMIEAEVQEAPMSVTAHGCLFYAYRRIGVFYGEMGQREKEEQYYKLIVEKAEEFARRNDSVEAQRVFADRLRMYGLYCLDRGRHSEALLYYDKSLLLYEWLVKKTGSIQDRKELARSYCYLSDLHEKPEQSARRQEYLEKAVTICEALSAETGESYIQSFLLGRYIDLSGAYDIETQAEKVIAVHEKMLKLCQETFERNKTPRAKYSLADAYYKVATFLRKCHRLDEAEAVYRKALVIYEELAQQKELSKMASDLIGVYAALAQICAERGQSEEKKQWYSACVDLLKKAIDHTDDRKRDKVRMLYRKLGTYYQKIDLYRQSAEAFVKAKEIAEQMMEESTIADNRRMLIDSYEDMGECVSVIGMAAAVEYCRQACLMARTLSEENGTERDKFRLARCLQTFGDLLAADHQTDEAQSHYHAAVRLFKELNRESEVLYIQRKLEKLDQNGK